MRIEEGVGIGLGAGRRHDLNETDERRNEEEDAAHGQNAENAEHDLVFQLILEDDEGQRRQRQGRRKHDDAQPGSRTRGSVHDRRIVIIRLLVLRHQCLFVCAALTCPRPSSKGINAEPVPIH